MLNKKVKKTTGELKLHTKEALENILTFGTAVGAVAIMFAFPAPPSWKVFSFCTGLVLCTVCFGTFRVLMAAKIIK